MERYGFYINTDECSGCRTCMIACKDRNNLPAGINYRRVTSVQTGKYPSPDMYHVSVACNHCENAPCVENCPVGAMHYNQADGTVQHSRLACIGCEKCLSVCPYGAPQFLKQEGKSGKCDGCITLRLRGENPACVDACLMRSLKFGKISDLEKEYGPGLVKDLPILPDSAETKPSLRIKAKACVSDGVYKIIVL